MPRQAGRRAGLRAHVGGYTRGVIVDLVQAAPPKQPKGHGGGEGVARAHGVGHLYPFGGLFAALLARPQKAAFFSARQGDDSREAGRVLPRPGFSKTPRTRSPLDISRKG